MAKIGYARVSTKEQRLDLQVDALREVGCEIIFSEKISSGKERPELEKCLASLRSGDVFVVWKLDRIGRSLKQLVSIISELGERKIDFQSITDKVDTTTPMGRLQFGIFAALAQYEKEIIKERTMAGLTAARKRGKIGGRPKGLSERARGTALKARELYLNDKFSVNDIAELLKISKATLYRYLRAMNVELRDSRGK